MTAGWARKCATVLLCGGLLLLGLGVVGVALSASADAATGANFVATGHDMDFHCSAGTTDECSYLKIVTGKVRAGSTLPILALDQGTELTTALGLAGESPVTSVDPSDAAAFNAVHFTNSAGKPLYSAIITASDSTCGGCDNTPVGEANINARAADFRTFFNDGGGILALAGADNRATYYNFVPLPGLTAAAVSPPFTVDTAGTSLGVTDAMANCCATHNSFDVPAKPFVTLESDSMALAETIAVFNASIGGGGFTSAPPSSSAPVSVTASAKPTKTAPTKKHSSHSAGVEGAATSSAALLAATGPNSRRGGVQVLTLTGIALLLAGSGVLLLGYRRPSAMPRHRR